MDKDIKKRRLNTEKQKRLINIYTHNNTEKQTLLININPHNDTEKQTLLINICTHKTLHCLILYTLTS